MIVKSKSNKEYIYNFNDKTDLKKLDDVGCIYSFFKNDLKKMYVKENIINNRPYVSKYYIHCVNEILKQEPYIDNIDIIKLNLELELDATEKYRNNLNFASMLSVAFSLFNFLYLVKVNEQDDLLTLLNNFKEINDIALLSRDLAEYAKSIVTMFGSISFIALVFAMLFNDYKKSKYIKIKAAIECIKQIEDDLK